ncbi:MAG: GMC family oxidoreductase [Myxococcota bacterium]
MIRSGREASGDLELDADTVIVGTGAGGAVAGAILAEAGERVLLLEEGPNIPWERYREMRPSEHLRHAWRDGGMTVAVGVGDSPTVNVTMGRCVGGSSMLTGGVSFRTPESVLESWVHDRGLGGLAPAAMTPYFEAVERAVHVETVPEAMRSRSTQLFARGAEKRGFRLKPLRRNTKGCRGLSRCNFGCPEGAKMSVDRTYLPQALAAGAALWSDCRVDRVLRRGDRVTGVSGVILEPPVTARPFLRGRPRRFRVHATRVVVAAGAYHSPLLLARSGLGRRLPALGRHLTLHPAFRMFARFPEAVRGWEGALQSAYSDHLEHAGITLVSLFIPPGVLAATMPGFGPHLTERARQIPNLAVFGGMIHDEGGGVVRRGPGREPLVTYRMSGRDRAAVPTLLREMAETFFAAGALEVFLPLLGHAPFDADAFARLDLERVPAHRLECSSQHPLGSCRMGSDPDTSVVGPTGAVWGLKNLFVADGSVVPTSLGVNPQITVMAMASRIATMLVP